MHAFVLDLNGYHTLTDIAINGSEILALRNPVDRHLLQQWEFNKPALSMPSTCNTNLNIRKLIFSFAIC
jgi:hypothetical protein